ncbi:MAG TPA: hypothetical protein VKZ41_12800 [Gemmatimonadales bacterium]|nr:hypothetical protein [Gemmatimonadales bacterium]
MKFVVREPGTESAADVRRSAGAGRSSWRNADAVTCAIEDNICLATGERQPEGIMRGGVRLSRGVP